MLYAAFGFLDYLSVEAYLKEFLIIRFAIVIPLLLLFVALSFHQIIFQIAQYLITLCLVVGGIGIAYMLIVYPNNFSYYGGFFIVIFSGYFLLKLSSEFALIGNSTVLLFFIIGFQVFNKNINLDTLMVIAFFAGANIIGAIGNLQLENMGRWKYLQEEKIKNQNKQLEARVISQQSKLLQIEKAFESTSDAMAIFSPIAELIYSNDAYTKLIASTETADLSMLQQLNSIVLKVINGGRWNGERTSTAANGLKKTVLIQADTVLEKGKIIAAVVICKDITERKVAESRIKYIGFHDNLTGLFSRHGYEEELSNLNTLQQLPLSIIMADLNGLKLLNDTYGHDIGDRFLQYAADVFKSICRESDFVARWGGDEFVILLPQTSYEQATVIAQRIIKASSEVECEGLPISMALGIACKEQENEDISVVMKMAEDSMYRQKLTESRSAKSAILKALNKALQVKSYETEEHTENMQQVAQKIGMRLGLAADDLARLDLVIRLHDIGKINIPTEILEKQEALTPAEWAIMKKHAEIGYRIVQATEEFAHVAEEILSHHERWDGMGYPRNLRHDAIPYLARIATIVDAYEVMMNGRLYKKPMTNQEVIAELKKSSGTQFDPELIAVFLQVICEN